MIIYHLSEGNLYIQDEIDRSFHTHLSQYIIGLYQNWFISKLEY